MKLPEAIRRLQLIAEDYEIPLDEFERAAINKAISALNPTPSPSDNCSGADCTSITHTHIPDGVKPSPSEEAITPEEIRRLKFNSDKWIEHMASLVSTPPPMAGGNWTAKDERYADFLLKLGEVPYKDDDLLKEFETFVKPMFSEKEGNGLNDGNCFVCGEMTNSLAGNPSLWGIYLAHIDSHQEGEKYTVGHRHYHVKCLYPILAAPKLEKLDVDEVGLWIFAGLMGYTFDLAKEEWSGKHYQKENKEKAYRIAKNICSRFAPAREVVLKGKYNISSKVTGENLPESNSRDIQYQYGFGESRDKGGVGMNSTILMKCLVVAYTVITITCLCERNYPKALYWFSACMITVSVLWGMK